MKGKTECDGPVIEFPLHGEWATLDSPGHHRFAFDLIAVDPDSKRYFAVSWFRLILGEVHPSDFYGWSQPVHSPFQGVVLKASDGWPDRPRLNPPRDLVRAFLRRPRIVGGDLRPYIRKLCPHRIGRLRGLAGPPASGITEGGSWRSG
jgi:hypothetical protein